MLLHSVLLLFKFFLDVPLVYISLIPGDKFGYLQSQTAQLWKWNNTTLIVYYPKNYPKTTYRPICINQWYAVIMTLSRAIESHCHGAILIYRCYTYLMGPIFALRERSHTDRSRISTELWESLLSLPRSKCCNLIGWWSVKISWSWHFEVPRRYFLTLGRQQSKRRNVNNGLRIVARNSDSTRIHLWTLSVLIL